MNAIDITRWNRKERRNFQKRTKAHIPGRNLPYEKALHGSWENYQKLRAKEITADQKKHESTDTATQ